MSVTAGDERQAATTLNPKAIVDFATGSHRRAVGVLLLVVAAVLPAGLLQHPADRPRRGALRAGHQADGGERRLHRHPLPGRGALQEAGRHLLAAGRGRAAAPRRWASSDARTRIWLYRIPSLIGAIGAVLLTYWAALAFVSRRGAVLAALMMASCVLLASSGCSPRPTPCCCSPSSPRWARWRAPICRQRRDTLDEAARWKLAGDLLDRDGGGRAAQGAGQS